MKISRKKFKKLVHKRGFHQWEFARKLRMRPETLSRYVNGWFETDQDLIKKIGQILEVPVSEFIRKNGND